jgi:hypothetical protein
LSVTHHSERVIPEPQAPAFDWLPSEREFSAAFLGLREVALSWIAETYQRQHLIRAADWVLHLDPSAPEPVLIAALTHDIERSVPGGPRLDMARSGWDDAVYTEAHCRRSADIVAERLREHGATPWFIARLRDAILQHEFGGTDDGNLMQAGDSLSYLEVFPAQTAGWAIDGQCSVAKARAKLDWMSTRIRHPAARLVAPPVHSRALHQFDRLIEAAGLSNSTESQR